MTETDMHYDLLQLQRKAEQMRAEMIRDGVARLFRSIGRLFARRPGRAQSA